MASPDTKDALALVEAGGTTFVSLVGEYSTESYMQHQYPRILKEIQKKSKREQDQSLEFVHLPIQDFNVPEPRELRRTVVDLTRRLSEGQVVYVHCKKGHGRTGLVAVALMAMLYEIDTDAAIQYVQNATSNSRQSDSGKRVVMPETQEQIQLDRSVISRLRARHEPVSYTHLRAHETPEHLVCRLLLEKKKKKKPMITEETYAEL
eukprot:TRINITY_DN33606_c0_g1_i3.p1 TRINITY_DN33606_c0_g1~~TRINITY_DN33606_c0_g1_i3.p1  ORF type:complete len:206 (-),score=40.78 TRINITY_DN33606_c0_g1_i3:24-641(-)